MQLSTEQNAVVLHGTKREEYWTDVPLIEGAETPDWLLDVDTNYLIGPAAERYSNRPGFVLLLDPAKAEWEERFRYENGAYIAESGDGRAACHYHGPLSQVMLKRTHNRGEELTWATQADNGYAGRWFEIKMEDGRDAILRGPWHGGPPRGYNDVTFTYWPPKFSLYPKRVEHEKRWRRQLCYFGLYVSDEVLVKAISRHAPHLRLARVKRYYSEGLEPRIDGQPPKGMTWEQRRD